MATAQDGEDVSYGAPVAAATLGDGTPFEAWGSTLGLFVHRGLDPALPEQDYQAQLGGCCGYDAQLAVDASSGTLAVTWYSNASGHHGVWYQAVDPATAAPSGSPALVPGTSAGDRAVDLRGRVPFTGCAGQPGTWVAAQVGYPSQSRVVLWRAGAATASTLDTGGDEVRNVALSCGPDGRLWVAWVRNAPLSLHVVRSNRQRTEFGAEAVVRLPRGSVDAYRLAAAAQSGLLDVVATIGSTRSAALRAIQVQPALDVAVRTTTGVRRGGTATIKATVTDAGDPVRGVVLSLAGHRVRTNRRGVATVHVRHVRRSHRYRMTASLRGFTPGVAATRVKVRR